MHNKRRAICVPEAVDERLAAFLGYLTGDGHISEVKRVIGLTTGDESQADHFARLTEELFGIAPRKKWDQTKWRMLFSSGNVADFLKHLGMKTGVCARLKEVPDADSPIAEVRRGRVPPGLLRLRRIRRFAGRHPIHVEHGDEQDGPATAAQFRHPLPPPTEQGRLLARPHDRHAPPHAFWKRSASAWSASRKPCGVIFNCSRYFKEETWDDEIVSVDRGRADVYDVSVEGTHRYAAQGFINHNSYWHSTIMTQKALDPSEVIDFADHHSGTMAMQRTRINPYKLGIELLRDIEERWNTGRFGKEYDECHDLDERRNWDKKLGLGRQKIFEVRRVHNDITFIDTFLTPEFCVRHGFFSYAFQEQAGQYIIESREFEKIKQRLLFSLTNFGKPWIYVVDGNFRNRGELLLRHQHNGVDLRLDQAADVLANLQSIWSRPVHLQTLVDGKPTMLSFDGTDHAIKTGGEIDDPRRTAPAKTR